MPKNEDQLHLLIENARDYAIFTLDDQGRILSQNSAAEHILGYSDADLFGQPLSLIFTPDDRADGAPEREIGTARTVGRAEDRRWHVKKDGTQFFADGVLTALRDAQGRPRGFGKVMRDVTDRKLAEEALEISEERLRFAVEGAGIGTWLWHIPSGTRIWSDISKALFGLPAEAEISAPEFLTRMHPDDHARWEQAVSQTLQTGADYDIEFRVLWPDGSVHWVNAKGRTQYDSQGRPERLEGIMQDITVRKEAEALAAEALAKQSRIAETLQLSMLQEVRPGRFGSLTVKTLYESALDEAELGGDFFDAFRCGEGRVALVVGDVSGKGLLAAARTAEVKYALRAFLHAYQWPQEALARLNDFLCDTQDQEENASGGFIVGTLAVVDPASGEATFAVAGAEAPMILRANGETEMIAVGGRPLGVAPDADYTAESALLALGDTLIMATDGITEARQGARFLGPEGMAALARSAGAGAEVEKLAQDIYEAARAFAGGSLRDDACLLLARRE